MNWMMSRESDDAIYCKGGILADEMGLGKTWETIGLLLNKPVSTTLILVPPVLQSQWDEALTKAGIPHRILVTSTTKIVRKSKNPDAKPKAEKPDNTWRIVEGSRKEIEVVLSTYDRAIRSIDTLNALSLQRIICDEGHALRNANTLRFQKLKLLEADCRWILSGTPVQNSENDFGALMRWMGVGYMKSMIEVLSAELILRRVVNDVKETVKEFPEQKPVHIAHPVTMAAGSNEKRVFDALVGKFEYAQENHAKSMIILELYLRIRQFMSHPQVYIDSMNKKHGEDYKGGKHWTGTAAKMDKFKELLSVSEKKPTIVFTNFNTELLLAEQAMREAGYKTAHIKGGQTEASRNAAIQMTREAAEKGEPTALVIQIVAGNAGINLQHMSRVIFLSSHWNPSVIDQAVARSYRIGQDKHVEVHHILIADGAVKNLDRYMTRLHASKRNIAHEIHNKLTCDAAVNTQYILDTLNEMCPEDEEYEEDDDESSDEESN